MTDLFQRAEDHARELQLTLADWVCRLPDPASGSRRWLKNVTDGDDDVARALGIPIHPDERRAIKKVIVSDHPLFGQFRSDLNQRIQIYLGGVQGIAASHLAVAKLRSQAGSIREIRRMLKSDPRVVRMPDRTLAAVAAAVKNGSLRGYRTGDVDSDLWVVLKTLQEHMSTRHDFVHDLVTFVANVVSAEMAYPGQHITDRRHAWWAVRTLHEAASIGFREIEPESLATFVGQLLNEPLYRPATAPPALSPEHNEKLAMTWELTNISELLRGPWRERLSADLLELLDAREKLLLLDVLDSPTPPDMRVVTVCARACMTFLVDESPSLWGRDT